MYLFSHITTIHVIVLSLVPWDPRGLQKNVFYRHILRWIIYDTFVSFFLEIGCRKFLLRARFSLKNMGVLTTNSKHCKKNKKNRFISNICIIGNGTFDSKKWEIMHNLQKGSKFQGRFNAEFIITRMKLSEHSLEGYPPCSHYRK